MHRLLGYVPLIAAGAAVAALVYVGAALYSHTANDLAWARRDAFAQSVQAGERVVAARNVAGAVRIELNAERARKPPRPASRHACRRWGDQLADGPWRPGRNGSGNGEVSPRR